MAGVDAGRPANNGCAATVSTSLSHSIDASGAGTVTVPVKPNGRVAKKLKKGGKATVNVDVTFTATGIAPNTETTKLKLKRKQKK